MNVLDFSAPSATDDGRAFMLLQQEREGIKFEEVERVQLAYGLSATELGLLLGIDARTVQRRKASKQALTPRESSAFLEVVRTLAYGQSVFGDTAKFTRWLNRPNSSLEGETPISLLPYSSGRGLVRDILGRIEYGVFG